MRSTRSEVPGGDAEPPVAGPVRIVEWPSGLATIEALARTGTPRLVLVEEGSEPPVGSDCCQDWMWRSGDEREMRLRLLQLSLRALAHGQARPHLDSIGLLHVGLRSVPLSPKERALAAVLLDRFNQTVSRDDLVQAVWPEGVSRGNVLATRISSLRSRIAWVGLEIQGSSGKGYTMRAMPMTGVPSDTIGFEGELGEASILGGELDRHRRRGASA